MPTENYEKDADAVEFTKDELDNLRREAIRLGLTPEQAKFIRWVAEVRKKGYVNATTENTVILNPKSSLSAFILNPTDANGNLYNFVTVLVNTDENDGNILLPTISEIVEQNIYPNISGNFGFQLKIFNNGSEGNSVFVQSAFEDQFGTSGQIELLNNASLVLSPVSSNNWSVVITK